MVATVLRVLFWPPLGLGIMRHALPSQCLMRGCDPLPLLPVEDSPSAHISFADRAAIALNTLMEATLGVGTMLHFAPSQRIARVCQVSVPLWLAPTAQASLLERADTP